MKTECSHAEFLAGVDAMLQPDGIRRVDLLVPDEKRYWLSGEINFVYVLEGARTVRRSGGAGDSELCLGPGDVLVKPHKMPIQVAYRKPVLTRIISVFVQGNTIGLRCVRCHPRPSELPVLRGVPTFTRDVPMMLVNEPVAHCLRAVQACDDTISQALLVRLTCIVFEEAARLARLDIPAPGHSGKLAMIRAYIEENCCRPLSRNDVAKALRMHPNHLSRLFHDAKRGSFSEYLIQCRLDRAIVLLRRSRLSVKEIASATGFGYGSSFYRQFVKRFGTSPSAYRAIQDEA